MVSVALSDKQSVECDTTDVQVATVTCTAPAWRCTSSMKNLQLCRRWTYTLVQNPEQCSSSLLSSTGFAGYTWALYTGNLLLLKWCRTFLEISPEEVVQNTSEISLLVSVVSEYRQAAIPLWSMWRQLSLAGTRCLSTSRVSVPSTGSFQG